MDWTTHSDARVQFYSRTAIDRNSVDLPARMLGRKLWLSLGTVKEIASVKLNGKDLGVVWTAPWRVEITSAATPGLNQIEIAVTNGWANRLIRDEQQPFDLRWEKGDTMKGGSFLKELPEWFLKHEPRSSKLRYTFTTWNYFEHSHPLVPSGLLGPVTLLAET